VWKISEEKQNKTGHPAVFPIKLAQDHILSWSNKGDLVLDPFTGSGTTGIAAYRTGRKFIGFEIDPVYYKAAKERLNRETAQVNLMDIINGGTT
jgi:site-specific DNA-methyltransferase (adenine-specific)